MFKRGIYRCLFFSVVISVILVCGTAAAAVVYKLRTGTTFQEGCVAPCMCPVMGNTDVIGTFRLVEKSVDPLFTRYRLRNISWTVVAHEGEVVHRITGYGRYRIGGEFALMQQLILIISIDGSEPMLLDSGLVPVESTFPAISISVDRGTQCYDIWIDIKASPR